MAGRSAGIGSDAIMSDEDPVPGATPGEEASLIAATGGQDATKRTQENQPVDPYIQV